jgi:hypothetical protein
VEDTTQQHSSSDGVRWCVDAILAPVSGEHTGTEMASRRSTSHKYPRKRRRERKGYVYRGTPEMRIRSNTCYRFDNVASSPGALKNFSLIFLFVALKCREHRNEASYLIHDIMNGNGI